MSTKKKILAITGIRSEYDILFPVIDTLRKDKRFNVKVVVSGAHLSDWHGFTLKKIEEDAFKIADKIDCLLMTDRKVQRAKGVGILISALTQTVEREKPDFLLVIGDREESISTAIVGNYLGILTAHIGGGDTVYGNADDPVRFAVSKLAHIHFAIAKEYAKNLKNIGEERFRIFNVGNPALDNISNTANISIKKVSNFLDFDISDKNYMVLIQHPLSSEKEEAYRQMETTLKALKKFCIEKHFKVVGIYPNTDPGSYDIIKIIESYKNEPFIRFYKTLPREIFVNLMRNAKVSVGNSSMGILEAPFYKLPVVNIGNRQKGRLNAGNVKFVAHNINSIKNVLEKACFNKQYRKKITNVVNPYGNGYAAEKIKKVFVDIDLNDKRWYVKKRSVKGEL